MPTDLRDLTTERANALIMVNRGVVMLRPDCNISILVGHDDLGRPEYEHQDNHASKDYRWLVAESLVMAESHTSAYRASRLNVTFQGKALLARHQADEGAGVQS